MFDDDNSVINKNVFRHKDGEIWDISASPLDCDLLTTVYNQSKHYISRAKSNMTLTITKNFEIVGSRR